MPTWARVPPPLLLRFARCPSPPNPGSSKVVARGLCLQHGARGVCAHQGCNTMAKSRGVCKKHGVNTCISPPPPPRAPLPVRPCLYGCNHWLLLCTGAPPLALSPSLAHTLYFASLRLWCLLSHSSYPLAHPLLMVLQANGRCSTKGCTSNVEARGLCFKHGGNGICSTKGCTSNVQSRGMPPLPHTHAASAQPRIELEHSHISSSIHAGQATRASLFFPRSPLTPPVSSPASAPPLINTTRTVYQARWERYVLDVGMHEQHTGTGPMRCAWWERRRADFNVATGHHPTHMQTARAHARTHAHAHTLACTHLRRTNHLSSVRRCEKWSILHFFGK